MTAKFQLSVCPHDTAKHMVEWFQLNTYLQRHLGFGIHFEPQDNFNQERETVLAGGYHIVYANPFSACAFIQELGFIPIARPSGVYDETILIRKAGAEFGHDGPIRVASASDRLIIHTLGLSLLDKLKISRSDCRFSLVGNHMKAAHAVIKGEADLGFVFNETWDSMAESTRKELEVVDETRDQIAFHCFCIAPEWADRRREVQDVLCDMWDDPKGKPIVEALHFHGFECLTEDALETLQTLLAYYNQAG
jgi:phosphonate transport system substrate-binding protein